MLSRASIAILILLAGAAGTSPSFAASEPNSAAAAKAQQAKQMKLARAKAKAQAEAKAKAKMKAEALAKAEQDKKDEWYAKDRDRGLDIASEYAPKTIAKVRKSNYIAKGDTVGTGGGNKGWRAYMDKYYAR
jgi:colicin import membrane protein